MDDRLTARSIDSFRAPERTIGNLPPEAIARLVAAASDIAVIVDRRGIVCDVALGNETLVEEGFSGWVGQPWVQTVTLESRDKIKEMLGENAISGVSRWRQVNHSSKSGLDVPVRYSAIRLGESGRVVAIGRDLRPIAAMQQRLVEAQQSVEREYGRLRQLETRYRLLFQISSEAVLIVDGSSGRVLDANPAAVQLLGRPIHKLSGRTFLDSFSTVSGAKIRRGFEEARSSGRADEIRVSAEGRNTELVMSCSVFREDAKVHFLVRLLATSPEEAAWLSQRSSVFDVVRKMPEGFVVVDLDRRILTANMAFLDMAQLATEEQVRGETIDRWLGRHPGEASVLQKSLREHGQLRGFATQLRGEHGTNLEVEVSGVAVSAGDVPCLGFTIHAVRRRSTPPAAVGSGVVPAVDQLTQLIGQVSLKDMVRESTDLIERMCIEAALELTGDNRSSAAEILGLSRQGLYTKLRRHGLGDL